MCILSHDDDSNKTSLGLLQGLRADDQVAWQRLSALYRPLLDFWCRNAHLQEADAADISQEVFIAVHRKIGEFRREKATDTFRGWLRTITHNKIYDLARRRRSPPVMTNGGDLFDQQAAPVAVEDADDDPMVEAQLLYRRALDLIRRDFEDHTWSAFWKVVIEGRDAAEVALELGVKINVIYTAKSRVLKRLREEFSGFLDH